MSQTPIRRLDAREPEFLSTLDALLDRQLAGPQVRSLWRAWNRLGPWPASLPAEAPWREASHQWRASLLSQQDLATRLLQFVAAKR